MSRETIKVNEVAAPTLFIGVGGTGDDIVKKVAELCRPGEADNISFVCLDTNVNDISSVKKSSAVKRIYYVQTSSTQTVGDYLTYDRDANKNWFPKNAVLYDKTVSEGAGQVRAISRLALNTTIKTGRIRPIYDAIDDLFRKNGEDLKQALRIVMVSTASGGTGSGILLPLSMYVRDYVNNKYPNTSCVIRALVLLPETLDSVIDSTQERNSQRRNAYATIKELNAFMMKGSGFCAIADELKRYDHLHVDYPVPGSDEKKSLSLLPVDFCFLLDGQNSEDNTLVSLEQYKVQAAQALYEQNIGPMQKRAFSVEDNIIKELSNPNNYGRNRFGGIGASVLRYPYEDIADYIAAGWALDAIGGQGEAAKWLKYDYKYEEEEREENRKDLSLQERKTRGQVYCGWLMHAEDTFSKNIRSEYLNDAAKHINKYFSALASHMHEVLNKNLEIMSAANQANHLAQDLDYKGTDASQRGRASENLESLRGYESAVKRNAAKIARTEAEAIFQSDRKTAKDNPPEYSLEFLIRNNVGKVVHPNAIRYYLYRAGAEMKKRLSSVTAQLDGIETGLEQFSEEAKDAGTFDLKSTRKKTETNLDELCAAEKRPDEHHGLLERIGGTDQIYSKLNEFFPAYYRDIREYGEKTAELEAYKAGYAYLGRLCKMFEHFYMTFRGKVRKLERKRDEIADSLAFRNGDSIYHVCADRRLMDELERSTKRESADGAMLSEELNAGIFDAAKNNVAFEKQIENMDIVEEDKRVDLFDDILFAYFRDSVRKNCKSINLNIIQAIAWERRLKARLKSREERTKDTGPVFDTVTHDQYVRYIQDMIARGERLAAPGIQKLRNEEPREIRLCAYNNELLEMRDYRIRELAPKGIPVDTISRYEIHFFNALYNITPDKLNKFSCHTESETGEHEAGLYHAAYVSYGKHIGPDSTKNMVISTHIDKRWDSVAEMPEIDFGYMRHVMMKIHQALIYGLVHRAIRYTKYSQTAGDKKVFKYENSDEKMVDLIVSNGTLCDEFYEILDALYLDASIVEDIQKIKHNKRKRDETRHSNYRDTRFARDVETFALDMVDGHTGRASLFEIPLVYYNTLPNSKRYVNEITSLVDAVIQTFKDELGIWEKPSDMTFLLSDILTQQFTLMMNNYKKHKKTIGNGYDPADNPVVDLIYRKVRKALNQVPEPDDSERTMEFLRGQIYSPDPVTDERLEEELNA